MANYFDFLRYASATVVEDWCMMCDKQATVILGGGEKAECMCQLCGHTYPARFLLLS